MLYLIKSAGYKEEGEGMKYFPLLKIGYTEDSKKEIRYTNYRLHNPTFQVLYEIPGATEDHEKRVQYRFRNLLFPDYGREWFIYSEEIIEFFKNIVSLEELENLPKSPSREDKEFKETKKVIKGILSYLLEFTEEEIYSDDDKVSRKIEKELSELISLFGDTLSEELVLGYYKKKCPDRVERYNQIKISRETGVYCEDDIVNREALEFLEEYNSLTEARKKMILLCESSIGGRLSKDSVQIVLAQIPDSDYIKGYYQSLGPERLKNLGYKRNNIERELGVVMFSPELLIQEIYSEFKEGERYTLFNLKIKLSNIYSFINYSSTPKANDIEKYFEIKEFSTYEKKSDGGRRKIRGYELVKSREHELREELKFAE